MEGQGEILMTDGGPNLDKWDIKLTTYEQKMSFTITMLKQIILSLKKIHNLGYTHGDLKLANICARQSHDGSFKFTLIDLGMSAKLAQFGDFYANKHFRGNLMFASIDHIVRKRASQLDDLYSLLCVAYYFVMDKLPWTDYIEELHANYGHDSKRNFY